MTTTVLNTKIAKIVNKISDISVLVSTTAVKSKIVKVKNKIPDVRG